MYLVINAIERRENDEMQPKRVIVEIDGEF